MAHRTQAEIAEAHAEAADALLREIHGGHTFGHAATVLKAIGPEAYFEKWVPKDLPLLRAALQQKVRQ
jgi:hypothetical protein